MYPIEQVEALNPEVTRIVVAPTAWKMIVIVPASGSQSFMVNGMRSPCSSMRSMMN